MKKVQLDSVNLSRILQSENLGFLHTCSSVFYTVLGLKFLSIYGWEGPYLFMLGRKGIYQALCVPK